jgi:dethiobiotin synthetase
VKRYFVTGIGTGVGKTVVSAILTEKLQADYWKPVQSGDLHQTDTDTVKSLISNTKTIFHPEAYRLNQPLSPHASAAIDGVDIRCSDMAIPGTDNNLVIEGAGGLMVPLNNKELMIDLIQQLHVEVVLVSQNYLGSINHTLLSIEALYRRNIRLAGIVFNGESTPATEEYILQYTGINCIGRIDNSQQVDKAYILAMTEKLYLPA